MPEPASTWSWRGRALVSAGALLATLPVWPGVEPGEPVADESRPRVGAGLALWLAGAGALVAVPVLDGVPVPPRDTVELRLGYSNPYDPIY